MMGGNYTGRMATASYLTHAPTSNMRYTLLLLLAGLFLAAAPSAVAQDGPVIYMTQHKVQQARMDSLTTIIQEFSIPWQNFIAENVEGYQRYFMRHDTGN